MQVCAVLKITFCLPALSCKNVANFNKQRLGHQYQFLTRSKINFMVFSEGEHLFLIGTDFFLRGQGRETTCSGVLWGFFPDVQQGE